MDSRFARWQDETTTYAAYSGYNALGQPGTLTLGNGTTTTYTYAAGNARLKTSGGLWWIRRG